MRKLKSDDFELAVLIFSLSLFEQLKRNEWDGRKDPKQFHV